MRKLCLDEFLLDPYYTVNQYGHVPTSVSQSHSDWPLKIHHRFSFSQNSRGTLFNCTIRCSLSKALVVAVPKVVKYCSSSRDEHFGGTSWCRSDRYLDLAVKIHIRQSIWTGEECQSIKRPLECNWKSVALSPFPKPFVHLTWWLMAAHELRTMLHSFSGQVNFWVAEFVNIPTLLLPSLQQRVRQCTSLLFFVISVTMDSNK